MWWTKTLILLVASGLTLWGQSRGNLQYYTNGYYFSPQVLSSNIVMGSNIIMSVDGNGRVTLNVPLVQGDAAIDTNLFQPASDNLTNWSGFPTSILSAKLDQTNGTAQSPTLNNATNIGGILYGSSGKTNWTQTSASGWLNTNVAGGSVNIANGNQTNSGTFKSAEAAMGSPVAGNAYWAWDTNLTGTRYALRQTAAGKTVVNSSSGNGIELDVNNSVVATVASTGIGINTNSPQATLHVNGSALFENGNLTNTGTFANIPVAGSSSNSVVLDGSGLKIANTNGTSTPVATIGWLANDFYMGRDGTAGYLNVKGPYGLKIYGGSTPLYSFANTKVLALAGETLGASGEAWSGAYVSNLWNLGSYSGGYESTDTGAKTNSLIGASSWPYATVNTNGSPLVVSAGLGSHYYSFTGIDNTNGILTNTIKSASGGTFTVYTTNGVSFPMAATALQNATNCSTNLATTLAAAGVTVSVSSGKVGIFPGAGVYSISLGAANTNGCYSFNGNNGAVNIGDSNLVVTAAGSTVNGWLTLVGALYGNSDIRVGAGGYFYWTGRSVLRSFADGTINLANNAQTSFTRLGFGPNSNGTPFLSVSGSGLALTDKDGTFVDTNIFRAAHFQLGGLPEWRDIMSDVLGLGKGAQAPVQTIATLGGVVQGLGFINDDVVYGAFQFNHDMATTNTFFPNLYVEPHVHLSVTNIPAGTSNTTWIIDYEWAGIGQSFITVAGSKTNTCTLTNANTHHLLEFGHITNNAAAGTVSSIMSYRLRRVAAADGDVGAEKVILRGADVHYPVNRLGSTTDSGY